MKTRTEQESLVKTYWTTKGWNKANTRQTRDTALIVGSRIAGATALHIDIKDWAGTCPTVTVLFSKGAAESEDVEQAFAEAVDKANSVGLVLVATDDEELETFEVDLTLQKEPEEQKGPPGRSGFLWESSR